MSGRSGQVSLDIPASILLITMSKPAYLAISEYSPVKPVIISAPSCKQCAVTTSNILHHALAGRNKGRFLNIEVADLQPHFDQIIGRKLEA